jgi:hypothetical protein
MNPDDFRILTLLVCYHVVTLLIGLVLAYLGYLLFRSGVFEKAGDLKAAWGDKHLTLKQAAPGTFFALFGTIVMSVSLWRGIDFSEHMGPTRRVSAVAADAPLAAAAPTQNESAPPANHTPVSDSAHRIATRGAASQRTKVAKTGISSPAREHAGKNASAAPTANLSGGGDDDYDSQRFNDMRSRNIKTFR